MPRAAAAEAGRRKPQPKPDPSNPNSWELGEVVAEQGFTTDAAGKAKRHRPSWPPGRTARCWRRRTASARRSRPCCRSRCSSRTPRRCRSRCPNLVAAPKWTLEPGEEFMALWGTGYDKGRAFVEIEHRRKIVQASGPSRAPRSSRSSRR